MSTVMGFIETPGSPSVTNMNPVLYCRTSDLLAAAWQVYFVVDKAEAGSGWKGGVGYITRDMLLKALPPPSDDSMVLVRLFSWLSDCWH